MDAAQPTQFAAELVPYEVNSPLWSDSADKTRALRLPAGGKIAVAADSGKWSFPVGTVFVKNFAFDGKLVETRLFLRAESQWIGYGYQWNESQTEAKLVPDERVKVSFDTGKRSVEWNYPNRIDCLKCHNEAAGSVLGPETGQFNRMSDGMNQIDRLAARGLFETPPTKPYASLVVPYASDAGSPPAGATLEERTRSYLHGNCAYCHRPGSDFPNLDLRYGVPLADMHICNVVPAKGDVGVPSATNLTPGNPMESAMWLRVKAAPNEGRMPQIGTYRVDEEGLKLIGQWIESISACP
ncbi:MAG TPA: hypothetical protein VJR89_28900 [Polyangiales bacterium]|nr:hypothetical protein [Polyangiales bacterium]